MDAQLCYQSSLAQIADRLVEDRSPLAPVAMNLIIRVTDNTYI